MVRPKCYFRRDARGERWVEREREDDDESRYDTRIGARVENKIHRTTPRTPNRYGETIPRFRYRSFGPLCYTQGKPHVMYLHCMVQENGFLEPLCTRTIPVEAQREEGCTGCTPSPSADEPDRYKSRKRSRSASASTNINCNILGLENLKEVLEPVSKKLTLEAEEAHVLRSKSEAAKSQAEAISSTVKALSDLTAIAAGSEHGDKGEYEDMIKSLRAKLSSLVSVGNLREFSDKI
jgi:hypothetical protein